MRLQTTGARQVISNNQLEHFFLLFLSVLQTPAAVQKLKSLLKPETENVSLE